MYSILDILLLNHELRLPSQCSPRNRPSNPRYQQSLPYKEGPRACFPHFDQARLYRVSLTNQVLTQILSSLFQYYFYYLPLYVYIDYEPLYIVHSSHIRLRTPIQTSEPPYKHPNLRLFHLITLLFSFLSVSYTFVSLLSCTSYYILNCITFPTRS